VTAAAFLLLALALTAAVVDWIAVRHGQQQVEYVAKPATLALLTLVALALDPRQADVRAWFVVALLLSLAGDVALMLPGDLFVPGLVAFLGAHLAYIVGLLLDRVLVGGLVLGLVLVAVGLAVVGLRLLGAVRTRNPAMAGPVLAYMGVISAMVVCACATGRPLAIAGALLFYASDATLARNRFVERHEYGDTAVMVTYHLAQMLLVLSLI
jgi:uncharacterized membrane protein YhhN